MSPDLEAWFSKLSDEQRQVATVLRDVVRANSQGLSEDLKWNQPCYTGKSMVCYIQKAKTHVSLGFGKGAKLDDPEGILEGEGAQLRHVKIPLGGKVSDEVLAGYVKRAVVLDSAD